MVLYSALNREINVDKKYKRTIASCSFGYIVESIVCSFLPLLFVYFQTELNVPLSKITLLITINFVVQLLTDLSSALFVDKIGRKVSVILADSLASLGIVSLIVLPKLFGDVFAGLLVAVIISAIGGGLMEVLISPIVESCPTEHKSKTMSFMHAFFGIGQVVVIVFSTLFFLWFGIEKWWIIAIVWALVPLSNVVMFVFSPVDEPTKEEKSVGHTMTVFKNYRFWIFFIMMVCAGASEVAVSQWASNFAETGLKVDKWLGDLLGPTLFALCMVVSRLVYGKIGDKIDLDLFMKISAALCVASYLLIGLVDAPAAGFVGTSICGFSVGIMWPGTFSKSAKELGGVSTAEYAFLALGGDMGCALGPTLVGLVSAKLDGSLRLGILCGIIFPAILLILLFFKPKKEQSERAVN